MLGGMKAVTADLVAATVRAARGSRSIAFLLLALVVLAPAVVGGCSSFEPGALFTVVGSGSSCDGECPPDPLTYSLRLRPIDDPAAGDRQYVLTGDSRTFESVAGYPSCIRAVVRGDEIRHWEAASCP